MTPPELFDPVTNLARFTLRQHATPEPASLPMLALGAFGLLASLRRRLSPRLQ